VQLLLLLLCGENLSQNWAQGCQFVAMICNQQSVPLLRFLSGGLAKVVLSCPKLQQNEQEHDQLSARCC